MPTPHCTKVLRQFVNQAFLLGSLITKGLTDFSFFTSYKSNTLKNKT